VAGGACIKPCRANQFTVCIYHSSSTVCKRDTRFPALGLGEKEIEGNGKQDIVFAGPFWGGESNNPIPPPNSTFDKSILVGLQGGSYSYGKVNDGRIGDSFCLLVIPGFSGRGSPFQFGMVLPYLSVSGSLSLLLLLGGRASKPVSVTLGMGPYSRIGLACVNSLNRDGQLNRNQFVEKKKKKKKMMAQQFWNSSPFPFSLFLLLHAERITRFCNRF